jgi:hypothetical protein
VTVKLHVGDSAYLGTELLLASRFSDEAQRNGCREHNVHLFRLPPPRAWSDGKQLGDEVL